MLQLLTRKTTKWFDYQSLRVGHLIQLASPIRRISLILFWRFLNVLKMLEHCYFLMLFQFAAYSEVNFCLLLLVLKQLKQPVLSNH